jgi:endoglucanase
MTAAPVQPPLSASGRYIVDAHGRRVRLAGVNWYGAHEDDGVVSGLERTGRVRLARAIARFGFNSVRLPFSLWMTEQATPVPDEYLAANPDLSGATPMQVYDACVEALTGAGLVVIPNCHTLDPGWCCADDDEQGLWFNDRWPAGRFFAAWQQLAARYRSNPLVAGMDIMNEPRRSRVGRRILTPAWGSGRTTDLAAMYTMAGNLIHEVSPDVLIICEGPGYAADLAGVARQPVRLERSGKVVYSLHDYSWFHPREQPRAAYLEQMHRAGGYLLSERIAPLWIGEFGIGTGSLTGFSGVWWNNFEAWLTENDVDWCWWALNGTQPRGTVPVVGRHRSRWGDGEGFGLLAPDWRGVANPQVLDILRVMIPPRTGPGVD